MIIWVQIPKLAQPPVICEIWMCVFSLVSLMSDDFLWFWISGLPSGPCTLTFWTSVTCLGSSFRLPALGDFWSISFGFRRVSFFFFFLVWWLWRSLGKMIKVMVKTSLKLMLFPKACLSPSHWSDLLLPLYFLGALCAVTLRTGPGDPAHLWIQSTAGLCSFQCVHPDSISWPVSLSWKS